MSETSLQTTKAADIPQEVIQAKQRFGIVGNNAALIEAIQRAIKVAPYDLSVLVTGESGTGKESFPKIIHQFSPRRHANYIAVNCGAIPEGTIDSELFGHERGAFTGAIDSRNGYFEAANGGTIFLDEVAELPLASQARLLRVLESGEYIRVGSATVQHTNVRVVAATNVNLLKAVAEGKFREDLYYRLSTVQIQIPALRDRGNDIMMIAKKFATSFSEEKKIPEVTLSPDAILRIMAYPWPGNVRQLKNVIDQVALFEAGTTVSGDTISSYLPREISSSPIGTAGTYSPAVMSTTYERERDLLFGLLFSLRDQLDALKEKVEGMTNGERKSNALMAVKHNAPINVDHTAPIMDVDASELYDTPDAEQETVEEAQPEPKKNGIGNNQEKVQPATLEESEIEMIRQALNRNDGNRKAAAAELRISERTLYRKIKQYGLE